MCCPRKAEWHRYHQTTWYFRPLSLQRHEKILSNCIEKPIYSVKIQSSLFIIQNYCTSFFIFTTKYNKKNSAPMTVSVVAGWDRFNKRKLSLSALSFSCYFEMVLFNNSQIVTLLKFSSKSSCNFSSVWTFQICNL